MKTKETFRILDLKYRTLREYTDLCVLLEVCPKLVISLSIDACDRVDALQVLLDLFLGEIVEFNKSKS